LSLVFQKITPKQKRRGRRRGKRKPNSVGVGPTSGQNLSYTRPQGADPPPPLLPSAANAGKNNLNK
jgi:hypothetical protein